MCLELDPEWFTRKQAANEGERWKRLSVVASPCLPHAAALAPEPVSGNVLAWLYRVGQERATPGEQEEAPRGVVPLSLYPCRVSRTSQRRLCPSACLPLPLPPSWQLPVKFRRPWGRKKSFKKEKSLFFYLYSWNALIVSLKNILTIWMKQKEGFSFHLLLLTSVVSIQLPLC